MTDSKLPVVRDGDAGRPPYGEAVVTRILKSLEIGCTRVAAYGEAGISEATFYRWLNGEREGFREAVLAAEAKAERLYTGRLARRAAAGDTRAIEFWLSRRRASNWREKVSVVDEEQTLEDVVNEAAEDDALRSRLADLGAEAERRRASEASRRDDPGGSAETSEPD